MDPDGHCDNGFCQVAAGAAIGAVKFLWNNSPGGQAVSGIKNSLQAMRAGPAAAQANAQAQLRGVATVGAALSGNTIAQAQIVGAAVNTWNNASTTDKASMATQAVLTAAGAVAGGVALSGASTEATLTRLATQAVDNIGPGSGAAYGTAVHSEFANLVEANTSLATEVSYKGGQVVPYGTSGSVRVDVVEGPLDAPTCCYDLKTGSATLTPARTAQIQNELPGGSNVPVKEIKP